MQLRWISCGAVVGFMCAAVVYAQQPAGRDEPLPSGQAPAAGPLKTAKDRLSYAIGLDIGQRLKSQQLGVDPDVVAKGLADGLAGGKPLLSQQEYTAIMKQLQAKMEAQAEAAYQEAANKNQAEGDKFLAENKQKQDVKTTRTGLQYRIVRQGNGATPALNDSVVAHYKGTLLNGQVFDSSYSRGEPATFPVKKVIPGWTEALQMMKVGDKWQLFIPSKLAYGPEGFSPDIPPNSVLIFDIELLQVKKAAGGAETVDPK